VAGWLTHCLKHVSVTVGVMSNNLQTLMNSAKMNDVSHSSLVRQKIYCDNKRANVVADRVIEASEA